MLDSDGRHFTKFCTALHARVPSLWLWAAGPAPPLNLPAWMHHHRLSAPLRCPPVVHREVEKGFDSLSSVVPGYSCAPSPPAVEGPAVRWLSHAGQRGHPEGRAVDCERCGEVIARLLGELRVGGTGTGTGTGPGTGPRCFELTGTAVVINVVIVLIVVNVVSRNRLSSSFCQ